MLLADERVFFHQLSTLVFSNPFSRKTLETSAILEGRPVLGTAHVFTQLAPIVDEKLRLLDARGVVGVDDVAAEDRQVLAHAYLFQVFQRFVVAFDGLIQHQVRFPESVADTGFADNLLCQLENRGFKASVSTHYFALFYQLRRAYYFIARALVGRASCMRQLREALWNNVFTHDIASYERRMWSKLEDFSTLLLGPTGSGKGSAAAAIGCSGYIPFDTRLRRFKVNFTQTFMAANLSQYPENLIESMLFGHRKGSFTGAIQDHRGLLECCSEHGALFLDEIGDASGAIQLKLLQVLQERSFSRVGEHEQRQFRGRVIAATNRPIDELRDDGQFRDDFFYRLSSDVIELPSLKLRVDQDPSELILLVQSLTQRLVGDDCEEVTDGVLDSLKRDLPPDYPWPGNVRELEQAVRRIILSGHYYGDPRASVLNTNSQLSHSIAQGTCTARQLLTAYCTRLYETYGTYEEVAKRTQLDRRTVKKYIA